MVLRVTSSVAVLLLIPFYLLQLSARLFPLYVPLPWKDGLCFSLCPVRSIC